MQSKVFWLTFTVIGTIAEIALPGWWKLWSALPIGVFC